MYPRTADAHSHTGTDRTASYSRTRGNPNPSSAAVVHTRADRDECPRQPHGYPNRTAANGDRHSRQSYDCAD